jgi:hypothetical protein
VDSQTGKPGGARETAYSPFGQLTHHTRSKCLFATELHLLRSFCGARRVAYFYRASVWFLTSAPLLVP